MLRKIVSIAGRPGLFKIVGQGSRKIIVEDIASGKRFPALERDKIISLGDIAMYTEGDDKPLGEILDAAYAKFDGKEVDVKQLVADGNLREKFAEVLPDFDGERVHDSDIKKLFSWYNILVKSGMTKFTEEEAEEGAPEAEAASEEKEGAPENK